MNDRDVNENESVNILITTDNNYVMPCTVLIESIIENNVDDIYVFILYTDLSNKNIEMIKKDFANRNVILQFIYFDSKLLASLPVSGHISISAYLRLFFLDALPENINRILYLDCDIIVNDNLDDLYYTKFKNDEYIAACEDKIISHCYRPVYKNLNMSMDEKYFNSGVILFDVDKIKNNMDFKKCLIFTIEHLKGKMILHDQDILNFIFKDKIKYMDGRRFNLFTKDVGSFREKERVLNENIILHYADKIKPWDFRYKYMLAEFFWKYARNTRYANYVHEYEKKRMVYKYIPFWLLRKVKRFFVKF